MIEGGTVDIAMSGITWRPDRAIVGRMSRAVAAGGPCVVASDPEMLAAPRRIAVNRGGILERWTRGRFVAGEVITAVDDNRSLPRLLAAGEVDAFVTDNFEVRHFGRGRPQRCEPAADRKVYWISPGGGDDLVRRVDAWIVEHEAWLDDQRRTFFGGSAPRRELDHLVDLLARRLAFMPGLGASKRSAGLPIEDLEQESRVIAAVRAEATAAGLEPDAVAELFRVQIEIAKTVQRRASTEPALAVGRVRPVLGALSREIVGALAAAAPLDGIDRLNPGASVLAPLTPFADADQVIALVRALAAVRPPARQSSGLVGRDAAGVASLEAAGLVHHQAAREVRLVVADQEIRGVLDRPERCIVRTVGVGDSGHRDRLGDWRDCGKAGC